MRSGKSTKVARCHRSIRSRTDFVAFPNVGGQHSTDVLEVENLTKFYGRHRGVEAVSFRVSPGEVVGFLGPNGSGKTTVMRMIMGLIKPTAGRIEVMGEPVS